jgi:hypothetical protein
MFEKDKDERYQDYLESDGSMFGKMDKDEWDQIDKQAEEIVSGETMGTFQRDERVWERVKKIKEE